MFSQHRPRYVVGTKSAKMLSWMNVGRPIGLTRQILPLRQYHLRPCGLRPKGGPPKTCKGVRRKTTEAGEDKSGHINAGPNEGILFLDSKQEFYMVFARTLC